ncbi:UBX domain-containing protein 10 [Engraulis encrasicolus]|uniref:UBX domain-containing protein 10 n=1 Tax=Engraulis encrasicolus TaxID=184585 RepID=UPI002FD10BBA
MHVSKPKSSKCRDRPKLSQGSDSSGLHPSSGSPRPPLHDRYMRSRGLHVKHSSLRSSSDIPELVEAISAPTLTLNKYRVLPSIETKPGQQPDMKGLEQTLGMTSDLCLRDNLHLHSRFMGREPRLCAIQALTASKSMPEVGTMSEVRCSPVSPMSYIESPEVPAEDISAFYGEGGLVLAIRTPYGSRVEHRFNPNHTLRAVIAVAEAQDGRRYRHSLVETMDMPRRSFTDLSMTLAQCGIPNRSVLCISHSDVGEK